MKLSVIDAGNFKLDGGSMFGVVPKSIWERAVQADENNMCNFNMRCLLVEDGSRLTLIDTGMGEKQPEKWQNFYYRNGEGGLAKSISNAGYSIEDITDVLLSHLHFDHCGGAVEWNSTKEYYQPTFPNAIYWTHSEHYASAVKPNQREKATFLTENIRPLEEAGQLRFIDQENHEYSSDYNFHFVDGHTEKMIMVSINVNGQKVVFAADTIPTAAHVHVPYVMAYDIEPLKTMSEKQLLLENLVNEKAILLFDHDVENQACFINLTEKGYRAGETGKLQDLLT